MVVSVIKLLPKPADPDSTDDDIEPDPPAHFHDHGAATKPTIIIAARIAIQPLASKSKPGPLNLN